MKLKELMIKNVQTTTPDTTLYKAASQMKDASVGMLPVLEGEELVGVLTDRDIVVRGLSTGKTPKCVGDVMTKRLVTMTPEAETTDAVKTMTEHCIGRLLLVDRKNHLKGVVSATDIANTDEKAFTVKELVGALGTAHRHETPSEPLLRT